MNKRKILLNFFYILNFLNPLISLIIVIIIFIFLILAIGENPINIFNSIYRFTLSNTGKIASIISASIPLFLSGLSVLIAFRCGIFNIGVEGQYFIGGLIGALAGIYFKLPAFIHIPVVILFCMLGGALWALIPAILKIKKGIHEVISTIMFNNIAIALVNYLVNNPLSGIEPGAPLEPRTAIIQPTAVFHKVNFIFNYIGLKIPDYVYIDYSLFIAIFFGIFIWIFLKKTRFGFEIDSVRYSEEASFFAGIKVNKIKMMAFLLSGAIAGLIGTQEIFAIKEFYTYSISAGLGFDGIVIALIGNNTVQGVLFSSLLFAFLKQSGYGMQLYTSIPNSIIYILTGLIIIFIVIFNVLFNNLINNLTKKLESQQGEKY